MSRDSSRQFANTFQALKKTGGGEEDARRGTNVEEDGGGEKTRVPLVPPSPSLVASFTVTVLSTVTVFVTVTVLFTVTVFVHRLRPPSSFTATVFVHRRRLRPPSSSCCFTVVKLFTIVSLLSPSLSSSFTICKTKCLVEELVLRLHRNVGNDSRGDRRRRRCHGRSVRAERTVWRVASARAERTVRARRAHSGTSRPARRRAQK